MELLVKIAWGLLALIHAAPAAVLVSPGTLARLYGAEPGGDVGVLLTHRGALFLALVVLCLYALFDPAVRRAAGLAVGISVVAFLVVYARAGFPPGPLRTIAIADLLALLPLAVALLSAWGDRTVRSSLP
jgi:hypothetical protein